VALHYLGLGRPYIPIAAIEPVPVLRTLEPGVPYSTTLSAVASKVDGTVSPSCFCGLEVDRELEFGDLVEGDLSRVCAVQDGVSGFELEVVKMLQVYVVEAVKIPLVGSVAGFAGDIGAVQTRQDISTILQCAPSRRGRTGPTRGDR
jgi:hypothetical protein